MYIHRDCTCVCVDIYICVCVCVCMNEIAMFSYISMYSHRTGRRFIEPREGGREGACPGLRGSPTDTNWLSRYQTNYTSRFLTWA